MPHAVRSRAPVVFLLLVFIALPAVAGGPRTCIPRGRSFLASLWQTFAEWAPGLAHVGGGQESNGSQGDLGPSLDPLG